MIPEAGSWKRLKDSINLYKTHQEKRKMTQITNICNKIRDITKLATDIKGQGENTKRKYIYIYNIYYKCICLTKSNIYSKNKN